MTVRSLRSLCVEALATHFDWIGVEDAWCLDSQVYAEILCHPESRASEANAELLESTHPHLESARSDRCYWSRLRVCRMAAATRGFAPLGELAATVDAIAADLERWLKAARSWSPDKNALLEALSRIPMSLDLLEATGVGKTLKAVAKAEPTDSRAATLLAKWKDDARRHIASQTCTSDHRGGDTCGGGGGDEQHEEERRRREDWVLARLGKCTTWKQIYVLLRDEETRKRASFRVRAHELAEQANRAKHLTQRLDGDPPRRGLKRTRQHPEAATAPLSISFTRVSKPGRTLHAELPTRLGGGRGERGRRRQTQASPPRRVSSSSMPSSPPLPRSRHTGRPAHGRFAVGDGRL